MKRTFWFMSGVATGLAGVSYTKRKVSTVTQRLTPVRVARTAGTRVRRSGQRVVDAVRDGRDAARARERELWAERDGQVVRLSEHLQPGDEVLVDGAPVESGRVILMRRRRSAP